MSKIILLAETGSDIPAEQAKKYGIYTVPMHVAFGSETRDDGTFPSTDIYEYFNRTGELTKTSGCTVGDFEKVFDELQAAYPDHQILHLAYSAVTTCSYQSALIAAEGRKNITSYDTQHLSCGQSLILVKMGRYLQAHPECTVQQALEEAKRISKACRMGFFPGDLAYLKAGGRVSNAAYMGAKILSLNPLIEMKDGYLKATKKYRGKMQDVAMRFMREFIEEHDFDREMLSFVYSEGIDTTILDNAAALAKEMGFRELLWVPSGGVITSHCGPGGFGISGISK